MQSKLQSDTAYTLPQIRKLTVAEARKFLKEHAARGDQAALDLLKAMDDNDKTEDKSA